MILARTVKGKGVEDHYAAGGLGDAVAADGLAVERLAVRGIPRSGRSDEHLERYGISVSCIAAAVHRRVRAGVGTAVAGRRNVEQAVDGFKNGGGSPLKR